MAGEVAAHVLTDFSEIARLWKDAEAVHGAPQSLEWIDNWRAIVNADSFVVGLFTEPRRSCSCRWKLSATGV
ncbi:hypothetical protein HED48_02925 [Ochrobactrum intermedium]|nr:hypothetical protein [Brucella intermedia]